MIARHVHAPLSGIGVFAEWLAKRRSWQRLLIAAAAGALAVLAMPPFGLWPVLFLSYPVLVWLLDGAAPDATAPLAGWRRTAATAWAFGFGFFLTGLHWIGSAFLVEADTFAWMIPFVAVILPGGLALFWAGAAVAARAVARSGPARVAALALAFALAEWLRGHILTGFPWNAAGYAFGVSDALLQGAAFWGLYGHTLMALLAAFAPALLAGPDGVPGRTRLAAVVLLSLGVPALLAGIGLVRLAAPDAPDVEDVRLRIVQPNVPQADKWRPELRAANFARLLRLSRGEDGLAGITHVIWPESAPPFLLADTPDARTLIADMLPGGAALITGAVRSEPLDTPRADGRRSRFYNSVFVLDDAGRIGAVYDKVHLVPFGEYLPLQDLLEAIGLQQLTRQRGGYSSGPGRMTLAIPNAPDASPLVCYEIIFPGDVAAQPRPGWLMNLTNDAWFGDSIGPRQHLAQARMRAVEEGLPVVRAANTGISAVIDARGQVRASLALGRSGAVDAVLPGAHSATVYARWGDAAFALMLAALAGLVSWLIQPNTRD